MRNRSPVPLLAALALASAVVLPALGASPITSATPAPELIAILQSPSASQKEKADACLFLARVGPVESVPVLVALLPDDKLSHMARYALEPMPYPEVDEAFRRSLTQLNGRQLVGVIDSIGVRRDSKATSALANLMRSPDPDVAQGAARAIGSIGTRESKKVLEKALPQAIPANRLAITEGLMRCAERLASTGDTRGALGIYDPIRQDHDLPHQVRAGALRGAILVRGDKGLPLIQEALRSDDFVVVDAAIRTAIEFPNPKVIRVLTQSLSLPPSDRQILILQALGQRADVACLAQVLNLARTGAKPVRLTAVRIVPQIIGGNPDRRPGSNRADEPAVALLVALLSDADREIAQAAQESLAALPGPAADTAVMAMLASSREPEQLIGIELVGRRRMTNAVTELSRIAAGPAAALRPAAYRRLGELTSPAGLTGLVRLLMRAREGQDLDAAEQAVATVCGRMDSPDEPVRLLVPWLDTADTSHKAALLNLLGSLGGKAALTATRAALADPDPVVQTAALRVLSTWKSADAVPVLLEFGRSTKKPGDRLICLRGYLGWATHADLSVQERLTICREAATMAQDAAEKKLLLAALGTVPSPESLPLIDPYLGDEQLRDEAAMAVLSVAGELLKEDQAKQAASRLTDPLRRIAQNSSNADLAKRAQEQLKLAEAKAGNAN
jgi:HEAT repeat protein